MDDMDEIFCQVDKSCEVTQKFCDQTDCTTGFLLELELPHCFLPREGKKLTHFERRG